MDEPISVSITRVVKLGCEAEFERALQEFVRKTLALPGQLGVHIIRPAAASNSREYGIVRKFADRESLAAFRASQEYANWSRAASSWTEGDAKIEELCGLESWFTPSGAVLHPLPKWKMALVALLGVYPTSLLIGATIGHWARDWHFAVRGFLFAASMVAILTWIVMPNLSRLLHGWLHSSER